jgi:hypothetical protein
MSGGRPLRGTVCVICLGLLVWGLLVPQSAVAQRARARGDLATGDSAGTDSSYIDAPPLPGTDIRQALRFHLESEFVPGADFDPGTVDLYAPAVRGMFTLPINDRAVIRLALRVGMSRYRFSDDTPFNTVDDPLDLYTTRLTLSGAYQLTRDDWSGLVEDEAWSVVGSVFGQSNWEDSQFVEGGSSGVALGVGYRIPGRFQLALGGVVRTRLDEGGADFGPFGSFRLNLGKGLVLRDRGLGAMIEYRAHRKVEVFASFYRTSDSFRLMDRFGEDDVTFRDRRWLGGAGVEYRFNRYLRVKFEAGAVASRKIRVNSDDFGGDFFEESSDPSPYFDLRFEIRPGGR